MRQVLQASTSAFFLTVWKHALDLIQQNYLERQFWFLGLGLHWYSNKQLHMPLHHNRQSTARGSWLLHVLSLYRQDMYTLLSLLQAG